MKKKILFIMPSMFIGGAERSLLGIFYNVDYDKYDVFLFLYRHEGEFLSLIPPEVHILEAIPEYATFDVPIKQILFGEKWKYGIARLWSKIRMRLHCINSRDVSGVWMEMQYISKALLPHLPQIPGNYDVGISFLGIPDVLLEKVEAKTKLAWNHTDYTALNPDKNIDRKLYDRIDKVISVSVPCTEQFIKVYPEFKEKAVTIENLLNIDLINRQAEETIDDMLRNDHDVVLLSVGRYSEAKNFDNVPAICKQIREFGIDVIWYIIGYGGDEPLIRQKIKEAGMENYVILLGKKNNPYPYIKHCDLYVQPSRYEGKAVTVREAQALHKTVVITNFATAASQLKNGFDGLIVPMDNAGCAEGIVDLLKNKPLMIKLAKNTYKVDYSNNSELEKLYQLIV